MLKLDNYSSHDLRFEIRQWENDLFMFGKI